MTNSSVLQRLAQAKAGMKPSSADINRANPNPTPVAPNPTPATADLSSSDVASTQPGADSTEHGVGQAKIGRRKWTEKDYKLRGFRTPSERAAEGRGRLNVTVRPLTLAYLETFALDNGLRLGEALDRVVELVRGSE